MGGPTQLRASSAGFSLVAVMIGISIMMLVMSLAVPSWKYVMKNAREEELIFRGGQIADAVGRYQKKHGNALPVSLEILVKGRYLRKAYKDPMTKDGKWRFLRQGEGIGGPPAPRGPLSGGLASPPPAGEPGGPQGGSGPILPGSPVGPSGISGSIGGFAGVASLSTDKSLRIFNGSTRYSDWTFVAGQPRIVGAQPRAPIPGLPGTSGQPRPPGPAGAPGQPGPPRLPGQ